MATIKAIDGSSIHQIQSGQVIVDLNSVVKELVENSLDAGATSIEIRFKNQGLDSIEVQDNGKGIAPEDYETVALKHHTSKLSSYEDLTSLDTFGFRGEAISSLCALSKFHLLTARAEDGAVGRKLDFEVSGKLKGTSVVAAQKGTSVVVDDLFYNLPVRRKELIKNIKRQFAKVTGYLQAYACISVGVRFSVSNQMPKGRKLTVFSTKLNTTTKENIANVYGAKTLVALTPLDLHLELEDSHVKAIPTIRNTSTTGGIHERTIHINGHISKPVFGEGRQVPDRQMFFVNSRPCALPQVSKAINEVYKSFNLSQSPFIFANLVMNPQAYDVNVSPDKRTIMLHDQEALLENLKASLYQTFERADHTVPQSILPVQKLPAYQPLNARRSETAETQTSNRGEESSDSGNEANEQSKDRPRETLGGAMRSMSDESQSLIDSSASRTSKTGELSEPLRVRDSLNEKQPVRFRTASEVLQASDTEVDDSMGTIAHHTSQRTSGRPLSAFELSHGQLKPARTGIDVAHTKQEYQGIDPGTIPISTSAALELDQPTDPKVRQRVQELNAFVDTHRAIDQATPRHVIDSTSEMEAPIQTIVHSIPKPQAGSVQDAFDRLRPKRTPLRTAEITIGDTTTTTVLGNASTYKKRRIHIPNDLEAIAQFSASPLPVKGLKEFALPGSRMQAQLADIEVTRPSVAPVDCDSEVEDGTPISEGQERSLPAHSTSRELDSSDADSDRASSRSEEILVDDVEDDVNDADYLDEEEKKLREDEKIARMIQEAEDAVTCPSEENIRRATNAFKRSGGNRKNATLRLVNRVGVSVPDIDDQVAVLDRAAGKEGEEGEAHRSHAFVKNDLDDSNAEAQLSLSVRKSDFERMRVVGQFNLGFVLAIRPATSAHADDELFIIDQHAADEKYNYERLQRTVSLQSQRLVRPLPLDLTAVEEELILDFPLALKANGFEIEPIPSTPLDRDSQDHAVRKFQLRTLPISGTKTFNLSDLEELLHLLSESSANSSDIPRPTKVQRILAMRACRSSIMVGKTLTHGQMQKVVGHMGEMEKPWNCPHGRPTMRHLAGLKTWRGWQEGDAINESEIPSGGGKTDWASWIHRQSL
nr:isoform 3 of mismatch repair endonuclease pms2 [Quercus suber]POE94761.1 isoform 3 of mismatch repair endonuclease pms2 [Quercus suber]